MAYTDGYLDFRACAAMNEMSGQRSLNTRAISLNGCALRDRYSLSKRCKVCTVAAYDVFQAPSGKCTISNRDPLLQAEEGI